MTFGRAGLLGGSRARRRYRVSLLTARGGEGGVAVNAMAAIDMDRISQGRFILVPVFNGIRPGRQVFPLKYFLHEELAAAMQPKRK